MHRPDYRPDIDGLRCCAVLPVVAYHAGIPGISGGFAGVDVFFVISGFLITSLVREQILNRRFALSEFYARRARRLFPALFTMLACSSLASWWLLMPGELEDFGESLATAAAFSSNIMFWSEAGYFEGPSEFKPLLHTWSLAVEEHFYLIFPALLLAIRNVSVRTLIATVFVLTIFSFGLQLFYIDRSPDAAFFLSPNRFYELLIGAFTAIAIRHSNISQRVDPLRQWLALLGAAMLAYSLFGFDDETQFPGSAALLPCVGTALIIVTGTNGTTLVNRALQWHPLVAIGLISYSLYLWHWPILVFLKHFTVRPPTIMENLAAVLVSVAVAWVSWRFIERTFHRSAAPVQTPKSTNQPQEPQEPQSPEGPRKILLVSASAIGIFIVVGLALDLLEGVPQRLPSDVARIASFTEDKPPERKLCTGKNVEEIVRDGLCTINQIPPLANSTTQAPDFIVWGDSHAMVLVPEFEQVAHSKNRTGLNATANGCAPLLGAYRPARDPSAECVAFNEAVLEIVRQNPTITNVILIARWAIYLEGNRYKHESGKSLLLVDKHTEMPGKAESVRVANRSLRRTLNELTQLGKRVIILAGVPEIGWDTPTVLAKANWRGHDIEIAPSKKEHQMRQRRANQLLQAQPPKEATVIFPDSALCSDEFCRVIANGNPLYIDEDHLSSAGARLIRPLIEQALANKKTKNLPNLP